VTTTPRRIFICTVGLAPQVATETVDVLMFDETPSWIPDRIELIATRRGVSGLRPLVDPTGPWSTLFVDGAPPVSIFVPYGDVPSRSTDTPVQLYHEIAWSGGVHPSPPEDLPEGLMDDVVSHRDAIVMGDTIKHRIGTWTRHDDTQVHVSIAGGRKTMSAHALMSLGLVGRLTDAASHVLVEDPDFEAAADFWHRRQGGSVTARTRPGADGNEPKMTKPAASIRLRVSRMRVPGTIELKKLDRRRLLQLTLSDAADQMALAAEFEQNPAVVFDDASNRVQVNGKSAVLNPATYAKLRLLVEIGLTRPPRKRGMCCAVSYDSLMYDALANPSVPRRNVITAFLHNVDAAYDVCEPRVVPLTEKDRKAWATVAAIVGRTMDGEYHKRNGSSGKTLRSYKKAFHSFFGSFTDVRDELAEKFGIWVAQRLLVTPRSAHFGIGCPREAIQVLPSRLEPSAEAMAVWTRAIDAENSSLPR
jgi:CRISPR-associated protein (TIGR02584 family)